MSEKHLVLIDGSSYLYRAFFALPPLSTKEGFPTQAIYGFTAMLLKVLKELKPEYAAVFFDHPGPTQRKKAYEPYKALRPGMPKELSMQVPKVFEIVKSLGLPVVMEEGLEADDLIASFVERFKGIQGLGITIVTQDKDLLQLLDTNVCLLDTMRNKKTTLKSFREEYGIEPGVFGDFLALMGDASDNIPGVPGIGKKTALLLIKQYGSLESLLQRIEELPPKKRKSILENRETLELSRKLVCLQKNGAPGFQLPDLALKGYDHQALYELFRELEFKRLIEELRLPSSKEASSSPPKTSLSLVKRLEELRGDIPILEVIQKRRPPFGFEIQGVAIGDSERVAVWTPESSLQEFFGTKPVSLQGIDLKPQLLALETHGVKNLKPEFDLALASYLLDPSRRRHGLEALIERFLEEETKPPSEGIAERVATAWRIKPKIEEHLKAWPRIKSLLERVEMPLMGVLLRMERVGIRVDTKTIESLGQKYAQELHLLQEKARFLAGESFNLNSPKQLQHVLFDKLRLPSSKKTKTGRSTDAMVLESLKGQHEIIDVLLEYRILSKLKGTYLDPLPSMIEPETCRIHSSFNQMATATGRLSSSEPNLQNLPVRGERGEEIRNIFISDPGRVFVAFDYSQVELRLLAHLSQDERLIQAFKEDQDIHAQTASLVFGVPKEKLSSTLRRRAKVINFGILYGMTPYGLSQELRIPTEEAKAFIENYFAAFPRVRGFLDDIIKQAEEKGYVESLLGRIRKVPGLKGGSLAIREQAKREAINAPIQGSAADLIKKAMVDSARIIQQEGLEADLVLQIHDELLFEVQEDLLSAFVPRIRDAMEGAIKLDVPLKADVRWGRAYGNLRDFQAENGR